MIIIEHALCVAMFNSELRTKRNDQNVFSKMFSVWHIIGQALMNSATCLVCDTILFAKDVYCGQKLLRG